MSSVFYRSPGQNYRAAVRGEGMYIYDADGKQYLDMSGGAAVSILGHQHPFIIDQITSQLRELAYAHTAFFTTGLQERLASALAQRFPDPGARVYFASGGSEANETAIKMVWQYWRGAGCPEKKIIISRQHSYHGNTFLTLSLSGNPLRRAASAAPLIDWPRITPCYPYRNQKAGETESDYGVRAAAELEDAIARVGAEKVAAFICEPVVGASLGAVAAVPGYLREVRRICDENNILLILDEVMCGSARCGTWFAFEQDDVCPDLVTLGKGLSAGYQPLAATIANRKVTSLLAEKGFTHGFTYVGHAGCLAAGCAVQDFVLQSNLLADIKSKGETFDAMLRSAFADHLNVAEIRGRGLLLAMELVADRASKRGFDSALAERLRLTALAKGMVCYPGQIQVDDSYIPHILLAPPAIVEEAHMSTCVTVLSETLAEALV